MPQQLLHPPQVKSGPDKVDRKAVSKRMWVDVNVYQTTVFLDDVPDLHAREGENRLKLRMLCVEMYSERRDSVSRSSITLRCLFPFAFVMFITWFVVPGLGVVSTRVH